MPRSPSDLADEIREGWLAGKASRWKVLREMVFVRRQAKLFDDGPFGMGRDIKVLRRKAEAARRAIRDVFDGDKLTAPNELGGLAMLAKVDGPDPRFDALQWFCAYGAYALIDAYGKGRAVGTKDGNAHAITQLLYEAITGKPQSDASCLGAVKSVLAWRNSVADANVKRSAE